MDKTGLADLIRTLYPAGEVKEGKQYCEVTVTNADLYSFAKLLRNTEAAHFDYLISLSGVDWGKELGVVYHLRSTRHGHMLVLKTNTAERENPVIDSVSDIWRTADFHEREVFDLLGIKFMNHPDLRRLFLDSSYGYPLRKDFVDDVNIVTK
jgi:NADH:ubiquinone oxidoreductase subunit C